MMIKPRTTRTSAGNLHRRLPNDGPDSTSIAIGTSELMRRSLMKMYSEDAARAAEHTAADASPEEEPRK